MNYFGYRIIGVAVGVGLTICGALTCLGVTPPGSSFNGRGKITLHRGQPCTSQIMFDFHPLNSRTVIWMAANAHASTKLTNAASDRRRVRISGTWRKGLHAGCAYVEVQKLVLERTWFESLFKP